MRKGYYTITLCPDYPGRINVSSNVFDYLKKNLKKFFLPDFHFKPNIEHPKKARTLGPREY